MKKIKRLITAFMASALMVISLPSENISATTKDNSDQYKYIMFAEKINLNSDHVSLNGTCIEESTNKMIDKQRSVIGLLHLNNSFDESVSLNQISNSDVGCLEDIHIDQEVINTESILYSKNGDINITTSDMNFKGFIYAPSGKIDITGKNVNLNAILIAEEITIDADNINANENEKISSFIGTESDTYSEINDIYTYTYDVFNHITKIDIGSRNLVEYTYKESFTTCLECEKYANDTSINYLDEFEDSDNQGDSALEQYVSNDDTEVTQEEKGDTIYYNYSFNDLNKDVEDSNQTIYDLTENKSIENVFTDANNISYIYDDTNQLIRENDKELNRTILYSYDSRGNLTSKKEYEYTEGVPITLIAEDNYAYDNDWKDCLVSYNGEEVQSDEIGNPLSYKGWSFTWEVGNQLKTAKNSDYNLSFDYDDFGLRMSKISNGNETVYKYIDRNIVEQDNGQDKLIFKYDDEFNIIGVNIDGIDYFYEKNIQNDIVKIVDMSGKVVVEYSYDSWGRLNEITGKLADTVGLLNPIRYRSYYYDSELKMYYLLSRYYDPDTGRFLSADDFCYLSCDNNLFKYCNNDPVNYIDINGHLAWSGGTPIIKSKEDYEEYENLVTKAAATLKAVGFYYNSKARTKDYLSATHKFGIRSLENRSQFLAQCAIESDWGRALTERGSDAYFATKDYAKMYSGGGYIHITYEHTYKDFADYIGDQQIHSDGREYVASDYPWMSAGWFYSVYKPICSKVNSGEITSTNTVSSYVTGRWDINDLDLNAKGAERRAAYKAIKNKL